MDSVGIDSVNGHRVGRRGVDSVGGGIMSIVGCMNIGRLR